jgi:hypothetical protein
VSQALLGVWRVDGAGTPERPLNGGAVEDVEAPCRGIIEPDGALCPRTHQQSGVRLIPKAAEIDEHLDLPARGACVPRRRGRRDHLLARSRESRQHGGDGG